LSSTTQGEGGHRHVPRRSAQAIQHLLGHTSIKTTEIYIKARLPDLLAPTSRPMIRRQVGDGK
jgi:hypothetical protein